MVRPFFSRGAGLTLRLKPQSYTCLPPCPPACHSPFLPSGVKLWKKFWMKLCWGFFVLLCFCSLPNFPENLLTAFPPSTWCATKTEIFNCFCSLQIPAPRGCLAQRRCPIEICGVNERMNEWVKEWSLLAQNLNTPSRLSEGLWEDSPGGPEAKTPHSQCEGPGFDPQGGN